MEKRISKLEATYMPGEITRAQLEQVAAKDGRSPDELWEAALQMAQELDREVPRPHTIEKMCRYVGGREGFNKREIEMYIAEVHAGMKEFG